MEEESTCFDLNFDEFKSLSSAFGREKVCEHVDIFGSRILIFSNRSSSSAQGPGAESEDEEDDEEEAVVSGALEIGNMGDGECCQPCLAMQPLSLSQQREREREPAFVSVCVWACVYAAVCVRE